jgi:tetratricopeptide (TPR) repeat protein
MAERRHISEATARAFFTNTLSREEYRLAVRHLLSRCEQCSALMRRAALAEGYFGEAKRLRYSFENILLYPDAENFAQAAGRIAGLAQWSFLEEVPVGSRGDLVKHHKKFQHTGLYDRLIDLAVLESTRNPNNASEIAKLALSVATETKIPETLRNDLMAAGYAILGNARRLAADFIGARDAYTRAWAHRESGSSDPMVDARIYQYEASWFIDQGQFEAADVLLQRALKEYRLIQDTHREGRTLLSLGVAKMYHDPQTALALFAQAESLFDLKEEPILAWCSRHNVIWCLNDLGETREALTLLDKSRSLYRKFARRDLWVALRLYWLEGRIAFNLNKPEEAEDILRLLFEKLALEGNHPLELVLIAVDLLHAIAVQQTRTNDAVAMIEKLIPLLRRLGLHQQGIAVWILLQQQIGKGLVDALKWLEIQDYFRRNWRNEIPYEPAQKPN